MRQGTVGRVLRLGGKGLLSLCPSIVVSKGPKVGSRVQAIWETLRPLAGTTLSRRVWAYRHGFLPDKLLLYGLTPESRQDYLPCLPYKKAHPLNGMFARLIDNKLFLPYVLGQWPGVAPRYFYMVSGNEVITLSDDHAGVRGRRVSLKAMLAACRDVGEVIIKPLADSGGHGVLKLRFSDGEWHVNSVRMPEAALLAKLGAITDSVVTECVVQHEYSARVFPDSVNTIRVVTMRDYDRGEQFVAYALHRFGCASSSPVDNWSQGGLCCKVDLETGRLSKATEKAMQWHETHPDTGAAIEGTRIANWESMIERIAEMANALAFIPYMGWDVVITADGFRILEINSLPGIYMPQVHTPLLTDSRVRAFYARHGVEPV